MCEFQSEFLVYLRHCMMTGKSSTNNRLIRYDDDSEPPFLNLSKRRLDTWKNLELFSSLDIVGPLPSQNTVPVKENRPKQGQPAASQKS